MQKKLLKILETILRWMVIAVIKKYKPTIIGITGSVGKTSAKEATYQVLAEKFNVRKNEKNNYNNELGIPLTIIGSESGNNSIIKWLKVFFEWLKIILLRVDYPEVIVLEMAVDHPGDMKYLASFIPVKIGVVTAVTSTHLEFFKNLDHIAREKGLILENIPENGVAILNADDEKVLAMGERTEAKKITFGFSQNADVTASGVDFVYENEKLKGISFKLNYEGKSIPVRLHNILATHQIYAVLAGVCIGIILKMNLIDIVSALEKFTSPCGRMNMIPGIKGSSIIDDTYNSSPEAALAALDVVGKLKALRRIVVLGDMLELGQDEEKGHCEIARKIFEINADLFFAVGDRMQIAVSEIRRLGFPQDKLFHFDSPDAAGKKIEEILEAGDLILVKGSQEMRMEKIIGKIMAEPEKARKFLCRQSEEWWKKPYIKP
jgi:UDP-N-acetylmuramoyl-tripeptide--D-alanyl-D-alanine ligase